jgi:hypothetical protein
MVVMELTHLKLVVEAVGHLLQGLLLLRVLLVLEAMELQAL